MNKDIETKTKAIVDYFKESFDYQRYLKIKEKMNRNNKIKVLVTEIKTLQKRIVNHPDLKDDLEKEIDQRLEELKQIPLYNEFLSLQEELNENIDYVKNTLNNYFNNLLN